MNRASTSRRSRWRRSKFWAARIHRMCIADRGASSNTITSSASSARMRSAGRQHPAADDFLSHPQPRRRGGDARGPRPLVSAADDADQDPVTGAERRGRYSRCVGSQPGRGRRSSVSVEPVSHPDVVFGALGAVMVVLALVPLARRSRVASPVERARVPARAVMARVIADLDEVQKRASGEGWSDDMIRARSAVRAWSPRPRSTGRSARNR